MSRRVYVWVAVAAVLVGVCVRTVDTMPATGHAQHKWLDYACTADGDMSVVNPKPAVYRSAGAITDLGACDSEPSTNYTYFTILDCPMTEDNALPMVMVTLSEQEEVSPFFGGGKNTDSYLATCNLFHPGLVKIHAKATVLFRTLSGFPASMYEEGADVEAIVRDLKGDDGYNVFTIGYPIMLELVVEAGTEMLPEVCVGYAGPPVDNMDSPVLRKLLVTDGCASDTGLMFNFSRESMDWWDRNVAAFDPDLLFHEMAGEGLEPEEAAPTSQPSSIRLWTHIFAFRFYPSMEMTIHCDVRLCPSGTLGCSSPCEVPVGGDYTTKMLAWDLR